MTNSVIANLVTNLATNSVTNLAINSVINLAIEADSVATVSVVVDSATEVADSAATGSVAVWDAIRSETT